jgi:hypothetical protein
MMRFDRTGAERFLAYLDGKMPLGKVLEHPAYEAVKRHASLYSKGISEKDVRDAILGMPSPFFGMTNLNDNLTRIHALLDAIRENEVAWARTIETVLGEIFPGEDLDIVVYPIIGYDMGIGLDGVVCMNCNYQPYLEQPLEFMFFIIHECVHVIYERHHAIPRLEEVTLPEDWLSFFGLWVQNEGYAVYTPFHLREKMGHMDERDYRVLSAPDELEAHRLLFLQKLGELERMQPMARDEYMETCFGARRLTYRIGCEMIRRIERTYGKAAVQDAFMLEGKAFVQRYKHLMEK